MSNRFLHWLETAGKDAAQVGLSVAEVAGPPGAAPLEKAVQNLLDHTAPETLGHDSALPASNPITRGIAGILQKSMGNTTMNQLEAFAITLVLGILNTVIKNPAHKAALQNQLLGVAADIQMAYGLVPPELPATQAATLTQPSTKS